MKGLVERQKTLSSPRLEEANRNSGPMFCVRLPIGVQITNVNESTDCEVHVYSVML